MTQYYSLYSWLFSTIVQRGKNSDNDDDKDHDRDDDNGDDNIVDNEVSKDDREGVKTIVTPTRDHFENNYDDELKRQR